MELRPAELLKEWRAGTFRCVYLLAGEEASAKREALEQLKASFKPDDFNYREFSADVDDEAAAIVSEAATLPVFSDRRLVVVSNPKIPAAARAAFAAYLKDPVKTTTLVLLSEERKVDAKDALASAAAAAGAVCVFSPLKEDEAQARLRAEAKRAGKELSEEAAQALVAEAGTDWGVLKQELEKALLFSGSTKVTGEQALESLGYRKASDPFALARLIQDRKLKESLSHLRRFLAEGKPEDQAFRALSQISSAVSRQLKAKRMQAGAVPEDAIFRALRLHSYWDRDFLGRLTRLPEARLRADLKRCLRTETDLKSKTWLDARVELEHLVIGLCASA